jgi:hypothetical protein
MTVLPIDKFKKLQLGIKPVQRAFIKFPRLKVSLVILTLVLLLASGFGVWKASTMPQERKETVTLINYQHQGEFNYLVYVEPGLLFSSPPAEISEAEAEEEEGRTLYFTNMIDDIDISFTYGFAPDYIVEDVFSAVDIVAIIHGPSGWQKEVPVISDIGQGDYFTIYFPLELEEFDEIINDIEDELELREAEYEYEYEYEWMEEEDRYELVEVAHERVSNVYNLTIESRVHVEANTGSEWIEDTFVQPMEISIGRGTLTWDNELNLVQRRYQRGCSYKHVGNFGYTIFLEEHKTALYGSDVTTLSPEPYQPPIIITRSPEEVYFPRIVDIMKSSFSYRFICDQPVTNVVEEIKVTATLEYPEMWQKTFTLVPKTEKSGDFVLNFPVDVNYFGKLTDVIRGEIGMGAPTHDLTISAEVHTTADTQFGAIDEVFTHTLKGKLGTTTITWDDELQKSEPGTIKETRIVADPNVSKYRLWSRVVAGVVLFLFLFVAWHVILARPVMSRIEEEAFRAKKKHKNVIVDITELPAAKPREMVVPIGSLDELIKAADNLLKPVLHRAEAEKHIYCVIDGLTRYEYISKLELPAKEELTEDERFQT